jgi:hypothetical protein
MRWETRYWKVSAAALLATVTSLFGAASAQSQVPTSLPDYDHRCLRGFRCVERVSSVSVVMRVEPPTVRPGGSVRIRLENRGTEGVSYALPFTLEHREHGRWVKLPSQGPFFAPLFGLAPGTAGEWQKVEIDRSDPPGAYRVQKRVWLGGHRKAAIRGTFRAVIPAE